MVKKVFAMLLSMVMLLSFFSVPVVAEESEENMITSEEQEEQKIEIEETEDPEITIEETDSEETEAEETEPEEKSEEPIEEAEEPEESAEPEASEEPAEEVEEELELAESSDLIDSGYCGNNVQWSLSKDGTLRIYGNGSIEPEYDEFYDEYYYEYEEYEEEILEIVIENGVQNIGESAFSFIGWVERIRIPTSVKSIGYDAFGALDNHPALIINYDGTYLQWQSVKIDNTYGFNDSLLNSNIIFAIKSNVSQLTIDVPQTGFAYTEEPICPTVNVYYDKNMKSKAVQDVDYTISYEDNVEIGPARIIINGIGEFEGQLEFGFEIFDHVISINDECVVECNPGTYTYNGKAKKPAASVSYNGEKLVQGEDYEVIYKNNINAGTAAWMVRGLGCYYGSVSGEFTIGKASNKITTTKTAWTVSAKATATRSIKLGAKATGGTLKYSSSNSRFKVSSKGVVTVPKNYTGKTTITITASNSNYKKATKKVTITVNKAAATKIKMPKSKKLGIGAKVTIKTTLVYKCEKLSGMKWSSSNKSIATVNSKGVVTGKKAGKVTITCKLANGTKYKCTVTVKKNAYTEMKYSDVEFADFSDMYGYLKVCFLDAYYSGKNLCLDLGVYNDSFFYAKKFDWISFQVYYNDTKIKTYKVKSIPLNIVGYGKKKITVKIPMTKIYNLPAAEYMYLDYRYSETMTY